MTVPRMPEPYSFENLAMGAHQPNNAIIRYFWQPKTQLPQHAATSHKFQPLAILPIQTTNTKQLGKKRTLFFSFKYTATCRKNTNRRKSTLNPAVQDILQKLNSQKKLSSNPVTQISALANLNHIFNTAASTYSTLSQIFSSS